MDPQTSESANWLWYLFTIGGNLSAIIVSIGAFVRSCRRQPPLTEELYKDFATKPDLEKLREDVNESLSQGTTLFREIERSIGRIEGKLETMDDFFNRKDPQ
jgi:hypothetical protein